MTQRENALSRVSRCRGGRFLVSASGPPPYRARRPGRARRATRERITGEPHASRRGMIVTGLFDNSAHRASKRTRGLALRNRYSGLHTSGRPGESGLAPFLTFLTFLAPFSGFLRLPHRGARARLLEVTMH